MEELYGNIHMPFRTQVFNDCVVLRDETWLKNILSRDASGYRTMESFAVQNIQPKLLESKE